MTPANTRPQHTNRPHAQANAARRYRAYPTDDAARRLTGWAHTCRALWNVALQQRRWAYRSHGVTLRAIDQCRQLTELRATFPWVADLPAQSAQQVLRNLDRAYDNWWNPNHPAGPPVRHKRDDARLAVPFTGQGLKMRRLNRNWAEVRLRTIGWVRFRYSRSLDSELRNCTISRDSLGWHVAFGVAVAAERAAPNGLPGCGVDFGVACSAFVSDEITPRLKPPSLTPGERRRVLGLKRRKARQITYAKRHNGGRYSKRLRRTIADIAKVEARPPRRRRDFTHKLTTDLAKSHGWVGIEDLGVLNMTTSARGTVEEPGSNVRQKAGLNRSVLDNIPGERRRQLAYKVARFGSELRVVPAPGTSQTCSACGVRDPESRVGCGRTFACTSCGHTEHADRNAALVIEQRAAGQAVNSTRSRPRTARPARRRLREPLASVA